MSHMSHIKICNGGGSIPQDNEVVVIARNMAGEDEFHFIVNKKLPLWELRKFISIQKNLSNYSSVHLAIDCEIPYISVKMYHLEDLLKKHNNVMQLLVNDNALGSDFVCCLCEKERDSWECVEWSDDPSKRCRYCNIYDNPHRCCYK